MATDKKNTGGFLCDEQGKRSSGRLAYWVTLPWILLILTLDSSTDLVNLTVYAYNIIEIMFIGNLSWVAGPRVAEYFKDFWGSATKTFTTNKSS